MKERVSTYNSERERNNSSLSKKGSNLKQANWPAIFMPKF
jgi:hypothetical protein